MPNIEIHGFAPQCLDEITPRRPANAIGLKAKIFELFKGKDYLADMVVTIYVDHVVDHQNKSQPFLRVVSTPTDYIDEIVQILLKELGIDIELQILSAFYPSIKQQTQL